MSPDGSKVFVTGFITGSASGFDHTTIVYGASAGAMLWTKSYDGPASADDGATALGVSPDGAALFVTGYSSGTTTGSDYATIAYSIT